eukprot:g4122.t1
MTSLRLMFRQTTTNKKPYAGKKALVVGAGPSGSLAASFLAKQGFQVYEKREDPTESLAMPSRSIPMILNAKTATVLRAADIDVPGKDKGGFEGATFIESDGKILPLASLNERYLTRRHDLAKHIMSIVRNSDPESIRFNFESACIAVDLYKKEVHFQYQDSETIKTGYDLLIGADGSNSEIRKAMEKQMDNFKVFTRPTSRFYKSIQNIDVNEDTIPLKYKSLLQPGALIFYLNFKKLRDIEGMISAAFTCASNGKLVANFASTASGFESVKGIEMEYLNAVMPKDFPQDWIDQMIPQLRDNPLYNIPSLIEVSTLVGPDVVLIGDAGHSVSPSMGMGCNMAIQDTQVLENALEFANGDINRALKHYNNIRHKEVLEIQQIEKIAYSTAYKQKGMKTLLPPFVNFYQIFHQLGHRYLPWLISKSVIQMFAMDEISAQEAILTLQLELAVVSDFDQHSLVLSSNPPTILQEVVRRVSYLFLQQFSSKMRNTPGANLDLKLGSLIGERSWHRTRSIRPTVIQTKTQASSLASVVGSPTEESQKTTNKKPYAGKKALVVGAGPSGSLAASFLAKQGFQVDVYEKREDPTESLAMPSRSIPMILNAKTARILRSAGIDVPGENKGHSNPLHVFLGARALQSDGKILPTASSSERYITRRHDLAKHILSTVRNSVPESIKFNFESACIAVDLYKKEVYFQYQDSETIKRGYDLLIGADGSNSEIRKAMEEQIDEFTVSITPTSRFYKSIQNIVVNEDTIPLKYKSLFQPGALMFYLNFKKLRDIEGMTSAVFTCASNEKLVANFASTASGFESVKGIEMEYLNAVMPKDFPQDWINQMIPQLRDNPLHNIPSLIEVSTLVGPDVVLIGDSGHSIGPSTGMGCNMAIQDAQVLENTLESANGDISRALQSYNDIRHKVVSGTQQLDKIVYARAYKQEGINKLLPFFVYLYQNFHLSGHKSLPWLISKSAIQKFGMGEISAQEAVSTLKLELGIVSVLVATTLSVFFKALLGFI